MDDLPARKVVRHVDAVCGCGGVEMRYGWMRRGWILVCGDNLGWRWYWVKMLAWEEMLACMKASLESLAVCLYFLHIKEKTRDQGYFPVLIVMALESKTAQPG